MRNVLKKAGAALLGALLLATATEARAEGPSLQLQGGVAVPTNDPQVTRFDPGFSGMVRPYIGLVPVLDIGPSFSYMRLPSDVPGVADGTAWGLGGGARLKRPHNHTDNTGTGFSAVSPYVAGDVQFVRTDALDRPSVILQVGAAVPTGDDRQVWIGPYLGYQQVASGDKIGFDSTDARIFGGGLSIEFDPFASKREKPKQEEPQPKPTPEPPKKVEEPTPPPKTVTTVTERIELKQKVPFLVDSSTLQGPALPILEEVLKVLSTNDGWSLQIDGHASSEGPPEPYNQKLSERRAQAVYDWLKSHGLKMDRVTTKGFSSTVPVADNKTEAGRKQNRRAEFELELVIVRKVESK